MRVLLLGGPAFDDVFELVAWDAKVDFSFAAWVPMSVVRGVRFFGEGRVIGVALEDAEGSPGGSSGGSIFSFFFGAPPRRRA
jgi:hypothetical protein